MRRWRVTVRERIVQEREVEVMADTREAAVRAAEDPAVESGSDGPLEYEAVALAVQEVEEEGE